MLRKPKGLKVHAANPKRQKAPRCKVHLDFHNSRHIPRIGWNFDPNEFGQTLKDAEVDAIVVFAKDMHGYCYYPSPLGPVHPGLDRDLLGEQVEACRARAIKVYAYYCTLWDNYLAEKHPEWRQIKRDGTDYMPTATETPNWTALCSAHEEVLDLFESHTREILTGYKLDGIYYDMPIPRDGECFCPLCISQIEAVGLDPQDVAVQRHWQHQNHLNLLARLSRVAEECRPGCQVDFNNQGTYGLRERLFAQPSMDIEALPTAQWGYDYYPAVAKYARCAGIPIYGMTGRFHGSWADFGGLKEPHQLEAEAMGILAQGALVDIGDQMPPSGKLDKAVYETLGHAFREVHRVEPLLEEATPVCECVVLTQGLPLDWVSTPSVLGWVKLLTQLHIQSDVMEVGWEFSDYPLVIVNADCRCEEPLTSRLDAYLQEGGSVLIAAEGWEPWLEKHGFGAEKACEFNPAYILPKDPLPAYEYAIYGKSWTVESAPHVLAKLGEPLFQRSPAHYTSHEQSPFATATNRVVAGCSEHVGFIGFDAGALTLKTGYWPYSKLVDQLLKELLPNRMIQCDAGPIVQIEAMKQDARFLLHLIHWNFVRPGPTHPPYLAPPIGIGPIRLKLDLREPLFRARLSSGERLDLQKKDAGYELEIPKLLGHDILILE